MLSRRSEKARSTSRISTRSDGINKASVRIKRRHARKNRVSYYGSSSKVGLNDLARLAPEPTHA